MSGGTTERPAVLVTGVSSGIGQALAGGLMERGYQVFGSVRREADAQTLASRWGAAFVPLVFDVTDAGALPGAVKQVGNLLGGRGLKALVNNAGVGPAGPLMHQPMEEIRAIFEVNVFGLLAVTRAFLPLLGARPDATHAPGRVVNIGSVSGGITPPFMGGYSASKHAVEAIAQGLRRELTVYGIEVSTVEPSFVRSKIFEKTAPAADAERYAGSAFAAPWRKFVQGIAEQERTAKSPEIVTRAVLNAIEAAKPRTRYPLDPIWHIGRLLPDRSFDGLIFKAMGIHKLMRPQKNA
jgi:NAD(P)-dependent dehydrogenase (short-subunit alcohol dehydrogenase family)